MDSEIGRNRENPLDPFSTKSSDLLYCKIVLDVPIWHSAKTDRRCRLGFSKNRKKTKKPISKVNDSNTWLTYEQDLSNTEWSEQGIGIMFAKNRSGLTICGIDIDAHHVDTNPLAKEIPDMFRDTYIEKSPSGKGYHVLFFAKLDRLPTAQTYKEQYQQKNSALDVECYISGMTNRYFTFTGNQVSEGDSLTDKTDTLLDFLEKYMKKTSSLPVNLETQLKLTGEERISAPIDVDKRLAVAMRTKNGDLFTALYNGDTSSYNSVSEGVQATIPLKTENVIRCKYSAFTVKFPLKSINL